MSNLPNKLQSGDAFKYAVVSAVNALIDYCRTHELSGDNRTIRMNKNASGITLSALPQIGGALGSESGYSGYFKVTAVKDDDATTLRVVNGFEPKNPTAGYAYYNIRVVYCPKMENIKPKEGFLCLCIEDENGNFKSSYAIEPILPDMPVAGAGSSDSTAKYPLAEISGSEDDGWNIRQISQYELPQLWCFARCEE